MSPPSTSPQADSTTLWLTLPLLALAGASLIVGAWAQFAPRSFFDDFPTGQGWVATDGPFNEHLLRDVGGLNLALGTITMAVALTDDERRRRYAALGWLIYGLAHFVYHVHHLGPFSTADAILVVISAASTPALAVTALAASARRVQHARGGTELPHQEAPPPLPDEDVDR